LIASKRVISTIVKMVKVFNDKLTKKDIVASPKDVKLDGVILSIDKGLLSEFVDPKFHDSFDNLEQEYLNISFECKFNGKNIKGTDKLSYYAEPMSHSKLGKFLEKYGELKAGQSIKVDYNGKGFGSILVE